MFRRIGPVRRVSAHQLRRRLEGQNSKLKPKPRLRLKRQMIQRHQTALSRRRAASVVAPRRTMMLKSPKRPRPRSLEVVARRQLPPPPRTTTMRMNLKQLPQRKAAVDPRRPRSRTTTMKKKLTKMLSPDPLLRRRARVKVVPRRPLLHPRKSVKQSLKRSLLSQQRRRVAVVLERRLRLTTLIWPTLTTRSTISRRDVDDRRRTSRQRR